MKKIWAMFIFSVLLTACASVNQANMDWIPIGPEFEPCLASDVEIFTDRSQIKRPYGNLGLLRIKNLSVSVPFLSPICPPFFRTSIPTALKFWF